MLARLRIESYALIDEVEVEFGPGLNVLTGETGAGKSILVDSMALLLGGRASTGAIRRGAGSATVEGVFVPAGVERLVRREIRRDRTNRCYLDGGLATLRMLRAECEGRVDLHGQREDRLLVRPSVQRDLLDAFAGALDLAERAARTAGELSALDRERALLEEDRARRLAELEYLREQAAEIDGARFEPGEDEALEAEATRLRNASEIARLAAEAHAALEGGENSVAAVLAGLRRPLERLAELDPRLAPDGQRMSDLRYELEDLGRELGRYAESVEHDPRRLAEVESRIDLLSRLARKHGPTLDAVLARRRTMEEEIAGLESRSAREATLEAERQRLWRDLAGAAAELADSREAAADRLRAAVEGRLAELGMGEGAFTVELSRRPDADGIPWNGDRWASSRGGLENVGFRIAPNRGEAPRPLGEIASGGELSRVLLALKAALAEADRTPTLIFDEIDAGIGGVVARRVAAQLQAIARRHQVIVVTHLAQIAAVADRHLVVEKRVEGDRTATRVQPVRGERRVLEMSRMLGGDPERKASLRHARELLGEGA